MKVIAYLAISANGKIASEDGSSEWLSSTEWESWNELSMEAGNVIMGRKTYDELCKEGSFPFPNRLNIVVSRHLPPTPDADEVIFAQMPVEALVRVKKRDYETAFVGGGGELVASMLKDELIDELILDVEPILIGKGVPLLPAMDLDIKLELLSTRKLSNNEMQLKYRVVKEEKKKEE